MALFFNLKALQEQSNNDPVLMVRMLYLYYTKKFPNKKTAKYYSKKPLDGHSFILNPAALFKDTSIDVFYVVQYIKLAGMRDYNLYKQYRYKKLNLSYYPDLDYLAIATNPLLTISNNELSFKHEESI
jgi:hypothetical protein